MMVFVLGPAAGTDPCVKRQSPDWVAPPVGALVLAQTKKGRPEGRPEVWMDRVHRANLQRAADSVNRGTAACPAPWRISDRTVDAAAYRP
jgi:hypothetical protein